MVKNIPRCVSEYDFDDVWIVAIQRFIEGIDSGTLLAQAKSLQEEEVIKLVSLLEVSDERVNALKLSCQYGDSCRMNVCRQELRSKLEAIFSESFSDLTCHTARP